MDGSEGKWPAGGISKNGVREYQKGYQRKHLSGRGVQAVFQRAVKKAGIKKVVTVHRLRYSFATHSLEGSTDLRYIQALLGHASSKTTEIYPQVSKRSIRKIENLFDRVVGKF